MKWLIGFTLAASVNAFLIGAFASPLGQLPHGEVIISDVTAGTLVSTAEVE